MLPDDDKFLSETQLETFNAPALVERFLMGASSFSNKTTDERYARIVQDILSETGNNTNLLSEIAEILSSKKENFAAAACYERLLGFQPENIVIKKKLGDNYLKTNQYEKALSILVEIDENNAEKSPFPALNLGRCLIGLGRWAEAVDALQRAIILKPNYLGTYISLAKANILSGDIAQFHESVEKAYSLNSNSEESRFWKAISLIYQDKIIDAQNILLKNSQERSIVLNKIIEILNRSEIDRDQISSLAELGIQNIHEYIITLSHLPGRSLARLAYLQLLAGGVHGALETLNACWDQHEGALSAELAKLIAGELIALGLFDGAGVWLHRAHEAVNVAAGGPSTNSVPQTPIPATASSGEVMPSVDDVAQACRCFLWRTPTPAEDWRRFTAQPIADLLEQLISSAEFRSRILPVVANTSLSTSAEACAAVMPDAVPDDDDFIRTREWALEKLPLSRSTKQAVALCRMKTVLLRLVLSDSRFCQANPVAQAIQSMIRVHADSLQSDIFSRRSAHVFEALIRLPLDERKLKLSNDANQQRTEVSNIIKWAVTHKENIDNICYLLSMYGEKFGGDKFYLEMLATVLFQEHMFDDLLILSERWIRSAVSPADAYWYKSQAESGLGLTDRAVKSVLISLLMLPSASANRTLEAARLVFSASTGALGKFPALTEYLSLARDLLFKARELGRRDSLVEYELSRLFLWQGSLGDATSYAAEAVKIKSSSKNIRLLAQCYMFVGKYKEAAEIVSAYNYTDDGYLFLKRLLSRFLTGASLGLSSFKNEDAVELNLSYLPLNPSSLHFVGEIRVVPTNNNSLPIRFRNVDVWTPTFDTEASGLIVQNCTMENDAISIAFQIERDEQQQVVILASKQGTYKFGGAEHFLHLAAKEYQKFGLVPQFLGLEKNSNLDYSDLQCIHVQNTTQSLRSSIFQCSPSIVHSVTGIGLEVMEALRGSAIYHIHGVHFWRDLKFSCAQPENSWFDNLDDLPIRREFNFLLMGYGTVYANSEFTCDVVRKAFGVTLPIIPSLAPEEGPQTPEGKPDDVEEAGADEPDIVLLANSRSDKGGYFVLDIAALAPERKFALVRNQDSSRRLEIEVAQRGLKNVELLGRVADMNKLYMRSKVVLVPSFDFVETFSRVPIEAHRYGIPVIGAPVGNIENILADSGILLSKSAEIWAAEIEKLFNDAAYYEARKLAASQNSSRWSFDIFRDGIARLAKTRRAPTLVAVGTGIGNMLHTTPMIQWLSRYLDAPVDIVISGDWDEADYLFAGSEFVNMVFPFDERILSKPYHQVFVSHSFGDSKYDFKGEHVYYSREWKRFDPAGTLHESDFNIEFVANALGVDVEASSGGYFLANHHYVRNSICKRIGLHAGSKSNHWAIKRWPYFTELAIALTEAGYEVVSFGSKSEVVEFSYDSTGTPLDQTVSEIMRCDYFISNDSGVMNIANALGIPQTALFAPTNPVTRGPVNTQCQILQVDKRCSPCETKPDLYNEMIAKGQCRCMQDLKIEYVLSKIKTHISTLYRR